MKTKLALKAHTIFAGRAKKYILSLILLLALGFAATPSLRSFASDRYVDLQLFTKVLNLVQQYYVEEVDLKKLIYGGVKGMLRELDPHTNFLPPDIFKEFESETSGEFGGFGVELTILKGVLTIISPIEDAPAWVAGIKAGDKIVAINGESTKGLSLVEAAQRMKGTKGTKIKLGIFREGFDEPKDFTIARGTVKIKSVKYTDLNNGFAYVKLTSFIENSFRDLNNEMNKHMQKNKGTKGLILDLRRNPGGLLDQAEKISDLFLEKGTIVSTVGRNKKDQEIRYAKSEGTLPNFPIIVLVDEFSASASEIVAGALQDNKRALIMGKRTFGKGSVQSVVKLGDGSGLKLTVARYYTPSGRSIQAEGIQPDVTVDNLSQDIIEKAIQRTEIQRERDMKGHLLGESENESNETESAQAAATATKGKDKGLDFWWNQNEDLKKDSSPRASLLRSDFQVLQAYNYLKAWNVMKSFDENKTQAKSKQ
ncbi:MAG: S41 family peptidase [Bdellovibrionota bacterium]